MIILGSYNIHKNISNILFKHMNRLIENRVKCHIYESIIDTQYLYVYMDYKSRIYSIYNELGEIIYKRKDSNIFNLLNINRVVHNECKSSIFSL